jgi:hypothetical protein
MSTSNTNTPPQRLHGIANYEGDQDYKIYCNGEACVGDEVAFRRAIFKFQAGVAVHSHYQLTLAKIKNQTMSPAGQISYTLELCDGKNSRISERNLYSQQLFRKPWEDEEARDVLAAEKRKRIAIQLTAKSGQEDMFGF